MLNKTITKFFIFVILATLVSICTAACHNNAAGGDEPPSFDRAKSLYDDPQIVGKIESNEIKESSGIAASKCQEDVIWTHNDSGDGPFIYALNSKGKHLGTWQVEDAGNFDWEDMASSKDNFGRCYLYIGEIGNTKDNERTEHKIYRVAEPSMADSDSNSTSKNARQTASADVLTFSYPDSRQDAETLMVHPQTEDIYVLTKHRNKPSGIYKIKHVFNLPPTAIAEKIADITVPAVPNGLLTGGEISSSGNRVILCDYFAGYELVLPDGAGNFDDIWKQKASVIELGERKQGEAIGYSNDGLSILATSEGKNSPLIEVKKRK
ncbi:MAG: hypothetical protein H7070_04360 [Saprospiraceae bacterium]|nr:hypothetical protein [Pyrinomonadaceae bacterium]